MLDGMKHEEIDTSVHEAQTTLDLVAYQDASVVSRVVLKHKGGSVTLFAFDADQELSEHTSPSDALVNVLEGEVELTVSGKAFRVIAGQMFTFLANKPHAIRAVSRFKMMLTMIHAT